MVKYHPDVRFLTDYTAGSLPRSQALCVAAHLHYCNACRARVRELTELGSELFTQQQPATLQAGAFDRLMGRLGSSPQQPARSTSTSTNTNTNTSTSTSAGAGGSRSRQGTTSEAGGGLPRAIARLCRGNVESLRWQRIGKNFRHTRLKLGDARRETTLFHIRAGGAVPHHRHGGDEITVVLKGSFSDHEDKYNPGDFIVRTQGEAHRPVASQDEDCLCLSTLDAPIRMSNPLLRRLLPLVARRTA